MVTETLTWRNKREASGAGRLHRGVLRVADNVGAAPENALAGRSTGTFAGWRCTLSIGGEAKPLFPGALAVDRSGNVALLDTETGWISRFNRDGKPIGHFTGMGQAAFGLSELPWLTLVGMVIGPDGLFYVTDSGHERIESSHRRPVHQADRPEVAQGSLWPGPRQPGESLRSPEYRREQSGENRKAESGRRAPPHLPSRRGDAAR